MKNWIVTVAFSQTDQINILVKNCETEEKAVKKAKKMFRDSYTKYWINGTIDYIIE